MDIAISEVDMISYVFILICLAMMSFWLLRFLKHATIEGMISMIDVTKKGRKRLVLLGLFLPLAVSFVRIFFFEEVREHPVRFFVITPIAAALMIWTVFFVYLCIEHLILNSCIHRNAL